eukprot:gene20626-40461_t
MLADRGNMAIVLVEQYYDFAQELADQYGVMERGAVLARGMGQNMEIDGAAVGVASVAARLPVRSAKPPAWRFCSPSDARLTVGPVCARSSSTMAVSVSASGTLAACF